MKEQNNKNQKPAAPNAQGNKGGGHNRRRHHNHHHRRKGDRPEAVNDQVEAVVASADEAVAENSEPIKDSDVYLHDTEAIKRSDANRPKKVGDPDFDYFDFKEPVPAPVTNEDDSPKVEVVGIRFKAAGKVYYFDPGDFELKRGEFAIVETARGAEFGEVCLTRRAVSEKEIVPPLRPVIRIATKEDIAHNEQNRTKEAEAFAICQEKIAKHELDMKLVEAQYTFDNSKLLFYFTSAGRVDFRELVKDLASVFRTRIELRQIGIRDEAKLLGGLGVCGRRLCCSGFLPDFVQVSIKMAKEQSLSLNSNKISGNCGRLMCCLRYEYDTYVEEIKKTPPVGAVVKTADGNGTVTDMSPLAGTIRVKLDDKETAPKTYKRDEVKVLSRPDPVENDGDYEKKKQKA